MPSETRYMRSDQHTINGLTAYKLGTNQTSVTAYWSQNMGLTSSLFFGIFVYKRSSDGSETCLSGLNAVAVVGKVAIGWETLSNTWNCPETELASTDAIVIRVKRYTSNVIPESAPTIATFITEQLGATKLDASTWTVYYRLNKYATFSPSFGYVFEFWWGTETHNSRVENFSHTPAETEQFEAQGDGFTFFLF